jgi:hypothetical protein
MQPRRRCCAQRVHREPRLLHILDPPGNQRSGFLQIQTLITGRIFLQIRIGKFEQRDGRPQTILLQMDKCPRQLNQAFVEGIIDRVPLGQPELLEHVVRLVKQLPVETFEVTQIMRIQACALQARDQSRNFTRFFTHLPILSSPVLRVHGRSVLRDEILG